MGFNIPDFEPDTLVAGDTWQWTRDLPDFPTNLGWSLTYYLAGAFTLSIAAGNGASVTQYAISVPATQTAGKAAGAIRWTAKVANSDTGEVHTVDSGVFNVLANPASVAAAATTAEQMFNAVVATLQARYTTDIAAYTTNQRQAHREQIRQLREDLAYWARAMWQERHPGQAFPGMKVVFESARWDIPGAWVSVEERWPFLVGTL